MKYVFPIIVESPAKELKEINGLLKELGAGEIKKQEEITSVPIEVPKEMDELQIKAVKAMLSGVVDVAAAEADKTVGGRPEGVRAYVGEPRTEE